MDDLELLARTELFRGVPAAELEKLRTGLRRRRYPRDEHLFREGDPGASLFVVVSGQVKISKVPEQGGEVVFAIVGPGEMFGELTVFEPEGERSADAQALDDVECLTIGRAVILDFFTARPHLLLRVIQLLGANIRRKDQALAEVAFVDIPGRIAHKLLELADAKGEKTDDGVRITIPLSQRTLAGMIGASRENVNRALQSFVQLGYIRQARGEITVLRPDALRRRG